jgi:hypothetical protein
MTNPILHKLEVCAGIERLCGVYVQMDGSQADVRCRDAACTQSY